MNECSVLNHITAAVPTDFWTICCSKPPSQRERYAWISYIIPYWIEILDSNVTAAVWFPQVQSYLQQMLEGVAHIHSMSILHLDLKVSSPGVRSERSTSPPRLLTPVPLFFGVPAGEHPDGVPAARRGQDLRLRLQPGDGRVPTSIQQVRDARVRGPGDRSPGARHRGHGRVVGLSWTRGSTRSRVRGRSG